MTGFGAAEGVAETAAGRFAWRWEVRSVNGRGLDVRLRVPEGRDRLEAEARRRVAAKLARGAVSVALKLGEGGRAAARLDPAALEAAVAAVAAARAAAERADLPLAPPSAVELLSLRGVFEAAQPQAADAEEAAVDAALLRGLDQALDALIEARRAEGGALATAAGAAIDEVEAQVEAAEAALAVQREAAPARLRQKVAALLEAGAGFEPGRLAQELALLAVKEDVREELDRLRAHIAAARGLLGSEGSAGRRLDFLAQEFNREANTLCAKSASAALTAAGLEMKVAIDRLREQSANLE